MIPTSREEMVTAAAPVTTMMMSDHDDNAATSVKTVVSLSDDVGKNQKSNSNNINGIEDNSGEDNDKMSESEKQQSSSSSSSEDDDEEEGDDDDASSAASSSDSEESDDNDDDQEGLSSSKKESDNNGLSDYERLRLERIKRNQERLEQLGLLNHNTLKKKKPNSILGRPKKQQAARKSEGGGIRRSMPKRSAKTNKKLSFDQEQLLLSFSVDNVHGRQQIRNKQKAAAEKAEKEMYSRRFRCYECEGCTRQDDCGTCIFCVDTSKQRRCIFRMCLRRLVVVNQDDDVPPKPTTTTAVAAAAATTTTQSGGGAESLSTTKSESMDVDDKQKQQHQLQQHQQVNEETTTTTTTTTAKENKKRKEKVMMLAACIKPNRLKKRFRIKVSSVVAAPPSNTITASMQHQQEQELGGKNNAMQQQEEQPEEQQHTTTFVAAVPQPRHIIDRVARNVLHELMQPVDDALCNKLGWTIECRSRKKHYFLPGEDWNTRSYAGRIDTIKKLIDFLKADEKWKDNDVVKDIISTFDAAVKEYAVVEEEDEPVLPPPPTEEKTDEESPPPPVVPNTTTTEDVATKIDDVVVTEDAVLTAEAPIIIKKEEPLVPTTTTDTNNAAESDNVIAKPTNAVASEQEDEAAAAARISEKVEEESPPTSAINIGGSVAAKSMDGATTQEDSSTSGMITENNEPPTTATTNANNPEPTAAGAPVKDMERVPLKVDNAIATGSPQTAAGEDNNIGVSVASSGDEAAAATKQEASTTTSLMITTENAAKLAPATTTNANNPEHAEGAPAVKEMEAGGANDEADAADDFDTSNDFCVVCSKGKDLIYCDGCKQGYHSACHKKPIREIPLGDWFCLDCKKAKKRPPKKAPREKREKVSKNLKLFEGEHDDVCYICFNGGELVCCDFCSKAFHSPCHIPPLPYVPTGVWKCCECSAVERTKKSKCGECEACLRDDCGKCVYCLDKPKFGGPGIKKQICVKRVCPYPRFAAPASKNSVAGETLSISQYQKKRSRQSLSEEDTTQPKKKRPKLDAPKKSTNVSKNPTNVSKKNLAPPPPVLDQIDDRPLLFPEDKGLVSETIYVTFEQMRPCVLMEVDQVGCYKNSNIGFPGLACRHCYGKAASGRFFPPWERSLCQTTTSRTIMSHVMDCRHCPLEIREKLRFMTQEQARMGPDVKRANKPKHGGRKVFFNRLWCRLHQDSSSGETKEETKEEEKGEQPVQFEEKEAEADENGECFETEADENGECFETEADENAEEPIVFKFKLSSLNSAYRDPDSNAIRKHIRKALGDPDNSKIQDKACELLRKHTTTRDNIEKVVLFGGVEMICNAMREHPDKSMVQAEACCTLAEMLWVFPSLSLKLAHVGAINLIIAAMNRHTNNVKVQQMGCGAFRALSYDGDSIKHVTNDVLSAVISSMERNPKKPAIQKEGCYFLQNMLVYDTSNASATRMSQVVPVIVGGMSNEIFDDEFRQAACGLIANLALDEDAKVYIGGKCGAVNSLIAALNTTHDVEVKQGACSALKHLALGNSDNQAKIYEAGGLQAAFDAVDSSPDDPVLLVAAFGLMKELCIHDEKVALEIVNKGGIQIILNAMKRNADLATMQVAAFGVIGYLLYENRDRSAPKLASAIMAALKNHCDSVDVQIEGCDALLELVTQVPAVCKILKAKNAQNLLFKAKNDFPACQSDVDDIVAKCSATVDDGGKKPTAMEKASTASSKRKAPPASSNQKKKAISRKSTEKKAPATKKPASQNKAQSTEKAAPKKRGSSAPARKSSKRAKK